MTDDLRTDGMLVLGGFSLFGGRGNGWETSLRGADQDWGNPTPQNVAVQSLLQNGAPTSTQGWDNREQRFLVDISAAESASLAAGEAAFMAEIGIPNVLVYTPPDGYGKPTVFEVWTSHLDYLPDDLVEAYDREYSYALSLTIRPFARALSEVVTEAVDIPGEEAPDWEPIEVVIDDCNSTTGWSGVGATVSASGGKVLTSVVSIPGAKKTVSVNMATTPLLVVDARLVSTGTGTLSKFFAYINYGTSSQKQLELFSSEPSPLGGGYSRLTYAYTGTFASLTISGYTYKNVSGGIEQFSSRLYVDRIARRNTPPAVGTERQKFRTLEVLGSAHTEGSLEITHETDALGHVVAYTWIDDEVEYLPPLRPRYLSGGLVVDDGTTVSGGYNDLDDTVTYEIPVANLPRGLFQLWARVRSSVFGVSTINWTAQAFVGGTAVGVAQSGSTRHTFGTTDTWRFMTVAKALMLPPVDVADGSTATVRITLAVADTATMEVDLDEAYLFWLRRDNDKVGAITYVSQPIPSTTSRLRIDTPTTAAPRPRILTGYAEDWTDAYYPSGYVAAWEVHTFVPPRMKILTVTTDAEAAKVRLRHYPRSHSHSEW